MHQRYRQLVVFFILAFAASSLSAAPCLKQVFNRYCLGGDYRAQLAQPPHPLHQQQDGESEAAIYFEGRERIYVMAFRGRIYKVVRRYRPSTLPKFQELVGLLAEKYGAPEDRSHYPKYARSQAASISAIRRGEGSAVRVWKPASDWSVELSWTREMGVALTYLDNALDLERRQSVEQGL